MKTRKMQVLAVAGGVALAAWYVPLVAFALACVALFALYLVIWAIAFNPELVMGPTRAGCSWAKQQATKLWSRLNRDQQKLVIGFVCGMGTQIAGLWWLVALAAVVRLTAAPAASLWRKASLRGMGLARKLWTQIRHCRLAYRRQGIESVVAFLLMGGVR